MLLTLGVASGHLCPRIGRPPDSSIPPGIYSVGMETSSNLTHLVSITYYLQQRMMVCGVGDKGIPVPCGAP
jgi:hypothetical protein